jgi:hypothetical protein
MIGSTVTRLLAENGHTISRLLRPQSRAAAAHESAQKRATQESASENSNDAGENPGEAAVEQTLEGTGEIPNEHAAEALRENVIENSDHRDVRWDPIANEFDSQAAEGADAVIHLAGASIGKGRWSDKRKAVLRSSRVDATRHLVTALGSLAAKPRVFLGISAVGFYGDRGEEKLTEHSGPGGDFLAQICRDWERESSRAAEFGARAAILRFGIVLSTRGGALPRMLLPIKCFVGGKLGGGRQWMSWLSLNDAAGMIRFTLENEAARGPINAVSPNPMRNADFIKTTARAVHRPAIFPAPAFGLRFILGEMADSLLLSSQRVLPDKLQTLGYTFQDTDLGLTISRLAAERK